MTLTIAVITNKTNLNTVFLDRLKFGDELLIEYSKDNLKSFAEKRNLALKKSKGDWILFVDDDEIISRELASEIKQAIKESNHSGYFLRRSDVVFGQELKHGEVGNIKILRLAKKNSGEFKRDVHEVWDINGKIGTLNNRIYHVKDNFISQFISRISFYGPIDAQSLNSEGKPFSYFKLFAFPVAKFIQSYFFKKGFLDGYVGLFLAYLMSIQSLSVRVFQWEKQTS